MENLGKRRKTSNSRLMGVAKQFSGPPKNIFDAEYVGVGAGLVLYVVHPEPIWGKSVSYAGANMIACMGDGKTTACIIAALWPWLRPNRFPWVTVLNYVILWGPNLSWMMVKLRLIFEQRRDEGGPSIVKVCLVMNDAARHHKGQKQDSEAQEAQDQFAEIRHGVKNLQEEMGWPIGGAVTVLMNVQKRTKIAPFFRTNVTSTWYYAFSMDPADNEGIINDLSGKSEKLRTRVLKFFRKRTLMRMIGKREANSECLVKVRSQDVLQVDFRRVYKLLDDQGLMDEEYLDEIGLIHMVKHDPEALDHDTLELTLKLAGERTRWPDKFDRIKAELRRISRDVEVLKKIKKQATKGGMSGLWGTAKALYLTIREEMLERGEITDPEDEIQSKRMEVLAWGFSHGRIPMSDRDDPLSGIHPGEILKQLKRASAEEKFGLWVKTLWKSEKMMTKWLKDSTTDIRVELKVIPDHGKHPKTYTSFWYFYHMDDGEKEELEGSTKVEETPIVIDDLSTVILYR